MFKEEMRSKVSLEFSEKEYYSEWGATYFSQSKAKTDQVLLMSYFRNLNRQIKCKPYSTTEN